MSRTSGQSRVQTTLRTFQDLDLCSKTVIMDVVGYIGKQQLRRKQVLWSWSDLIWWYRVLAFPQNVQFLLYFCFIMISWVDSTGPTFYSFSSLDACYTWYKADFWTNITVLIQVVHAQYHFMIVATALYVLSFSGKFILTVKHSVTWKTWSWLANCLQILNLSGLIRDLDRPGLVVNTGAP